MALGLSHVMVKQTRKIIKSNTRKTYAITSLSQE